MTDTAELQSLLDTGGNITLDKHRVYVVSGPRGGFSKALTVRSNTNLNLNLATIKLADDQQCGLLGQDQSRKLANVAIYKGTLDGNGAKQSDVFPSVNDWYPTVWFSRSDNVSLRQLSLEDTYFYSLYNTGDNCSLQDISVVDAIGGGIWLNGDNWTIGDIAGKNVSYWEENYTTGNPFIVNLKNSAIGHLHFENFGFGVKFQGGCRNVAVKSIEAVAGPNNYRKETKWWLVKIQGENLPRWNDGIKIDKIICRGGPRSGLYIWNSRNVHIGKYVGVDNGKFEPVHLEHGSDCFILSGDNIHFDEFISTGAPKHAFAVSQFATNISVDRITPHTIDPAQPILNSGESTRINGLLVAAG